MAAGILAGLHGYLDRREALWLAVAASLLALIALLFRRDRSATMLALLGCFLTGNFLFLQERDIRPENNLEALVDRGLVDLEEPVRVTGWISARPAPREFSEAFEFAVETIDSRGQSRPASGRVRLYHYIRDDKERPLSLRYGDRLSVLLRRHRVLGYANSGRSDREATARREGLLYQGTVKADELVEKLPGRGGSWMGAWQDSASHALLDRLDRLFPIEGPPGPTNGILRAMLPGYASGLDGRASAV